MNIKILLSSNKLRVNIAVIMAIALVSVLIWAEEIQLYLDNHYIHFLYMLNYIHNITRGTRCCPSRS